MTSEDLDEVIDDMRRYAFCRRIIELSADDVDLDVVVKFEGDADQGIVLHAAEMRPLAEQVQQRIVARLLRRGVQVPGVGT